MNIRLVRFFAAVALATFVFAPGCASTPKGDPSALDMPKGVSVSQDGLREVAVSWSKPTDGSVRYRIERAEDPDGAYRVVNEGTPDRGAYTDRGTEADPLADSKTYYYRMVAIGPNSAESAPSEVVKTVTAPPPQP